MQGSRLGIEGKGSCLVGKLKFIRAGYILSELGELRVRILERECSERSILVRGIQNKILEGVFSRELGYLFFL